MTGGFTRGSWLIGKIVDAPVATGAVRHHALASGQTFVGGLDEVTSVRGFPPSRPLKDGFRPRVYYSNTVHLCRRSSPLGVFVDPWRRSGRVNAKRSA